MSAPVNPGNILGWSKYRRQTIFKGAKNERTAERHRRVSIDRKEVDALVSEDQAGVSGVDALFAAISKSRKLLTGLSSRPACGSLEALEESLGMIRVRRYF